MLAHRAGGNMPQTTLTAADLTFESFECYLDLEWDTPPDDDPNWYLSTDNDPHILYDGGGYIETVRLYAEHRLPPAAWRCTTCCPARPITARRRRSLPMWCSPASTSSTWAARNTRSSVIDPDSVGGVATLFTGVELNPPQFWLLRFVPNGGQLLLLLGLPACAAAAWALVRGKRPENP